MVFFLSFAVLSCHTGILSSVVLAILNPYWNLEGSFCPVLLMGHLHDVYWVNRSESTNLSTSSVLFLLLFSKFTSLNNCKYTHYLHHWPVQTCIGRETSHTRMFQAQCAYILPTVALMRASFLNVIKKTNIFKHFHFIFLLIVQRRLPGNYRADTLFPLTSSKWLRRQPICTAISVVNDKNTTEDFSKLAFLCLILSTSHGCF